MEAGSETACSASPQKYPSQKAAFWVIILLFPVIVRCQNRELSPGQVSEPTVGLSGSKQHYEALKTKLPGGAEAGRVSRNDEHPSTQPETL